MSFKNQRMQRRFACLGFVTATAFLQTNSWTSSLKTGSQWPAVRNAGRACLYAASAQSGRVAITFSDIPLPLLNQISSNDCIPFTHAVPLCHLEIRDYLALAICCLRHTICLS